LNSSNGSNPIQPVQFLPYMEYKGDSSINSDKSCYSIDLADDQVRAVTYDGVYFENIEKIGTFPLIIIDKELNLLKE